MPDPIRYTFARAFTTEAAARAAWQAAARAATARPDNISVTRLYTPEGQHVVALIARDRPAAARPWSACSSGPPGASRCASTPAPPTPCTPTGRPRPRRRSRPARWCARSTGARPWPRGCRSPTGRRGGRSPPRPRPNRHRMPDTDRE